MKNLQVLVALVFLLSSCSKEDVKKDPPADLPAIVINEFLASNTACCQDPDGQEAEFDDWLELYNAGNVAVDIGGWYVSDKADQPKKFQIPGTEPSQTTIQPGEYLLLWADNQPEQGVLHLDFALNADGEYIGISSPEGHLVDETTFDLQSPDVSSARIPDGTGEWGVTNNPTPGAGNQ